MIGLGGGLLLDEDRVADRAVFTLGQTCCLTGGGNRGKDCLGVFVSELGHGCLRNKLFSAFCAADAGGQARLVIRRGDRGVDDDVSRMGASQFNVISRNKLQDRCCVADVDFAVAVDVAGK